MLDEPEAERASATVRRAALSTVTRDAAKAAAGDGLPCSACGHPVEPSQPLYTIPMRGLIYGFHVSCYSAWVGGSRCRPESDPAPPG